MPKRNSILIVVLILLIGGTIAWPQQPPLALVGGTVVDLANWGRSANDLASSVVIIRDGKIEEVGTLAATTIPKGARILDCTGKYIIPGLVDGFAGMSSQAEANANLYMGVTTVVASSDDRHGREIAGRCADLGFAIVKM